MATEAEVAMLERWAALPLADHLDARETGLAAALRALLFERRQLRERVMALCPHREWIDVADGVERCMACGAEIHGHGGRRR